MKRLCLLLFLFTLGFTVVAASPKQAPKPKDPPKAKTAPKPPAVLKSDTGSAVEIRALSADSIRKFAAQPAFNYKEQQLDISWWERFWRWFWHLFDGDKHSAKKVSRFWYIVGQVVEYLLIALGGAAIILIILKISGVDVMSVLGRKSKTVNVPYSEYLEDINAIDFDKEVEAAIGQHNYRLAVRLLYLKCLKKLSDAGLIDWQISKTNTSYINELADAEKRSMFSMLTRRFEYVWYGEFDINTSAYNDIQAEFSHFNSSIK